MNPLLTHAVTVFMAFFAIMNPIAITPVFLGLTRGDDKQTTRSVALRSLLVAFAIVALFSIAGKVTLLALRWKADAILDFAPHLAITAFNPHEGELTFTVSNGIDATPTQAMNRLAAAPATGYTVLQMSELGGDGVSLSPTIQYHDNGTATATFTPYAAEHAFFKLCLIPALD